MNVKQLKQELTKRVLPTDGLKPALVERLEQAMMMQSEKKKKKKISNEAFHSVYPRLESAAKLARKRRGLPRPGQSSRPPRQRSRPPRQS